MDIDNAVELVEEWLKLGADLESSHKGFLEETEGQLAHAIYALFDEKSKNTEVFENVVKQLFNLTRSSDSKICDFVYQFIPNLVHSYLAGVSSGDKKGVSNIEVTLIGLYNREVLSGEGVATSASFRLPTLARQSIYHESDKISSAFFTTDSLQRYEAGDAAVVHWGPSMPLNKITASSRYHLVTALLVAFNARIASFPDVALMQICKTTSKLVTRGFSRSGFQRSFATDSAQVGHPTPIPRIPVTSDFIGEFVHAVYFAMLNGYPSIGLQAIEDLHMRATYELYSDVILMTNAVKNSVQLNPIEGQGDTSSLAMNTTISSLPSTPLTKSYITNASFRTKKLPDDIPIQSKEGGPEGSRPLKSINESEESGKIQKPNQSTPKDKEKSRLTPNIQLAGFGKKREKDKLKNGDKKDSGEKKNERRFRQDKEAKNEANRNSGLSASDLSFTFNLDESLRDQNGLQDVGLDRNDSGLEMTALTIEDESNGALTAGKDLNSSQNQTTKVS